eukprot:2864835-Rhodomonas_salina.1
MKRCVFAIATCNNARRHGGFDLSISTSKPKVLVVLVVRSKHPSFSRTFLLIPPGTVTVIVILIVARPTVETAGVTQPKFDFRLNSDQYLGIRLCKVSPGPAKHGHRRSS